jgi:hypothetical protein
VYVSRTAFALRWRAIVKIGLLISLLIAANIVVHEMSDALDFQIRPGNEDAVHRTILVSAALYSILLAIPFVPGAEIGLAMMTVLGPPIVLLVYVCTVAGLSLSFAVGRIVPLSVLIRLTQDLHLHRTSRLLKDIEPCGAQERLEILVNKAPTRLLPVLLRYRYLALGVALNTPGNFLIGGGGGIALFAGISRLYSLPGFLITIAVSVAPVPIAVLVFGASFLAA